MHGKSGVRKNKKHGNEVRSPKSAKGYMNGGVVKKTITARGTGASTKGKNHTAFHDA